MDEKSQPFDFEQQIPIRLSQNPKVLIPLRQRNVLNRGHMINRRMPTSSQGKDIQTLNRISKKEVLIFRRINGTLLIRESFLRIEIRLGSKFHITPMSSNIPMEQDIRILGIKTTMTIHFLIGMDSIGKMERDSNLLLPDGLRRNQKRR